MTQVLKGKQNFNKLRAVQNKALIGTLKIFLMVIEFVIEMLTQPFWDNDKLKLFMMPM